MLVLVPLHAFAGQADDKLIAQVHLKANTKLDSRARKEIAAAAAKIKKFSGGAVKLRGIYALASTPEEYLAKSVFMAREVELYLKTLLPSRQQIYTVASQFSPRTRGAQSVVEILFYPYELKQIEDETIKVNTLESRDVILPSVAPPESEAGSNAVPGNINVPDEKRVTYERKETVTVTEDAKRAEELVRRAKERALERAKHKDDVY